MRKENTIKNYHKEALRYLANGDKLLEKTSLDREGFYKDFKYVKLAGHAAWNGILISLDPLHPILRDNKRKSINTYRNILSENPKIRSLYNRAYTLLHLQMGYDGYIDIDSKIGGWEYAKKIIKWAKMRYERGLSGIKQPRKTCKKCKKFFTPERVNIVNCKNCRK